MAVKTNVPRITVEVADVLDGREKKAFRPDSEGYYHIPGAILGAVTRNKTFYEVDRIIEEVTGKPVVTSLFQRLTTGGLYGEYGHPSAHEFPNARVWVQRLFEIWESKHSHFIGRIYTDPNTEINGGIPLMVALKPAGPYGKAVQESLDDPDQNSALSLRSILKSSKMDPTLGAERRTIQSLITFDFVGAGGFAETSKRYGVSGNESLSIDLPITRDLLENHETREALEAYVDREQWSKLYGEDLVELCDDQGIIHGTAFKSENQTQSIFHKITRRK